MTQGPKLLFSSLSWLQITAWARILTLACTVACAHAGQVQVAVAANFTAPMQKIAEAFEKDTGHKAIVSFGATGTLYAQVTHGAPYEVFLSADEATVERLQIEGKTVAGTRFTYAIGQLVLWSPDPLAVDAQGNVLKSDRFQYLAIANPKLAPYGAAAMSVMEKMGLTATLQPRLVQGESITQAYQFVATSHAQIGFIALSQVMANGTIAQGSAWRVPQDLYPSLRQDAVLLTQGKDNLAAAALMQYLRSSGARGLMQSYGYGF